MNNPQFVVLFHQVNYPLASAMTRDLVHAGFAFSLLCEEDLEEGGTFASRIRADHRPMILMVSDNFLKDASCVHQLLPALQERDPLSIQIIVLTEGYNNGSNIPSPTRLDRVGQILHYINHWQDRYLKLRKQQAELGTSNPAFEQELKWTRQIAFDIGNLIEYFREHSAYAWEAFTANHYELFFRKSGNISLHEDYKQQSPFTEDDRELETRLQEEIQMIREQTRLQKDDPEGEEILIREMLQEEVVNSPVGNDTIENKPEKDLLTKLIAYKNGLVKDDSVLDDREMPDAPEDDEDWDDEEEEETGKGGEIVALPGRDEAGWRRLIELDPTNITARIELATLLSKDESSFNETTGQLEEVLRLDPKNARAFYLLGQISEQYKELKLAQRYYEKAVESDPSFGQAHFALGTLLEQDPEHKKEALSHFSEARNLLPERAEIWVSYGTALGEAGQKKKAIKALKKALKLDPGNEEISSQIAELYFSLGDRIKALRYYKETSRDKKKTKAVPVEPEMEEETEAISDDDQVKESTHKGDESPSIKPTRELTVLITGATSGIGRATARLFAERGHRLILTGRREDRLSSLQAELEQKFNATVFPMAFDLRQEAVTRQLIRALPEEWSDIDVLINNAGLAKGLSPIHEGKISDWDTMIDTNIKGLLYMTRAVSPGMVARKRGHIINICSTAGKEVYPSGNVYCATKFAVDALTKSIRQDLVASNIRVGQVSPGHVEETEFALNRFDGDAEKAKIYNDFNPLRSRDVAEAIWFIIHQPPHVNILDITLTASQQASASLIDRSGRIYDSEK